MNGRPRASADEDAHESSPNTATIDGHNTNPDVLSIVTLTVVVAAFAGIAGPKGVIAGVTTAGIWYVIGTPYAVAAGHVALVVLFPEGIDPSSFALVEAAFVALVLASGPRTSARTPIRYGAAVLASAGTLGGVSWYALGPTTRSIWVAAAVLLATIACGAYVIHRYERVFVLARLELTHVESERRPAEFEDGPETPPATSTTASSPPSDPDTES